VFPIRMFLVRGSHKADRQQKQILPKSSLQFEWLAGAVAAGRFRGHPQVSPQARGEFRGEADLHGAAVRRFVVQGGQDAIAMLHEFPPEMPGTGRQHK
jgi:hypothetical protein